MITSFILYDSSGTDVTELFDITYGTGRLQVYLEEITVSTGSAEKIYDAAPLSSAECSWTGALLAGHTVSVLRATGEQTDVGNGLNLFEIVIVDENGKDVTYMYKVNAVYGTLRVTAREITVTAGSSEREYIEGEALVCNEYALTAGTLAEGHTAEVTVLGSQTAIGYSDNIVSSVIIRDENGQDVTSNYSIRTEKGTLRVTYPAQ